MEKHDDVQAGLQLARNLAWGAELLFGQLEAPSTKIPKWGRQNKHQ